MGQDADSHALHALFGRALRQRREDAGMTQEALARRLGLDPGTIAAYEAATAELEAAMLWRICAALGIGISDFCAMVSALASAPKDPTDQASDIALAADSPLSADPV